MNPKVELHIAGGGVITLELDEQKAPKTVANFLSYVKKGHYDGTIFHRVIDGFMIQGGGFAPGMNQKPTDATIENEANNGLKNKKYTVAMARTMVGSSDCPPSSSRTSTHTSTKSGNCASARASGLSCQAWLMNTRMGRAPLASAAPGCPARVHLTGSGGAWGGVAIAADLRLT